MRGRCILCLYKKHEGKNKNHKVHAVDDVNFGYAIMLLPLVHYFVCY